MVLLLHYSTPHAWPHPNGAWEGDGPKDQHGNYQWMLKQLLGKLPLKTLYSRAYDQNQSGQPQ